MKTKLLLPFILFSVMSYAQAPINSFYGVDNAMFAIVNSSTPIDQTASGANLTWNFNQLTVAGSSLSNNAEPTPAELTSYPNTTSVTTTNSTINATTATSKIYSSNLANVASITAATGNDLELNYITNNATLGAFPMSYGFSNTDATAGTYVYTTYSGTFTGTITTTVDAYGILNLNDIGLGAYSGNVTRLKTVQNISLSYSFFGVVGTVTQTTYSYYDSNNGSNHPMFRYASTYVNIPLLSIDQTLIQMERFSTILLGTEQAQLQSNELKIVPNPVDDVLNIQNINNQKINSVMISDTNGRIVLTSDYFANSLNVSHLQKGIYFARINTDAGTMIQKIIKK